MKEEEKTQRPDLYVLATGYSGQLRNKVPNMMRESDFHQVRLKAFCFVMLHYYLYFTLAARLLRPVSPEDVVSSTYRV